MTLRFGALVTGSAGWMRVPLTGWEHRVRRQGLGQEGEFILGHAEIEVLVGYPGGHILGEGLGSGGQVADGAASRDVGLLCA